MSRLWSPSSLSIGESNALTQIYPIGGIPLLLPKEHALPTYREHWALYDKPIEIIANSLRELVGVFHAIDIGANVGDSAALINAGGPTPVLCIEGDPTYHSFLDRNATTIGKQIIIEKAFVGERDGWVSEGKLERHDGTTAVICESEVDDGLGGLSMCRLETLLDRHREFDRSALLKIDTDGYDFPIILSHQQWICTHKPVIFFEYLIDSVSSHHRALECIDALSQAGYAKFLVFDNFGNQLPSATSRKSFEELNSYLLCNRKFGTAVHYCDVCAIPPEYASLAETVHETMLQMVLR